MIVPTWSSDPRMQQMQWYLATAGMLVGIAKVVAENTPDGKATLMKINEAAKVMVNGVPAPGMALEEIAIVRQNAVALVELLMGTLSAK